MLADHIGVSQLRDLAGRSERLNESVSLTGMVRLADLLHPGTELANRRLNVAIEFHGGLQGFPEMRGRITGPLQVSCQRCLGPMDWIADTEFRLVVVGSERDLESVAEPFDTVVAGEHGVDIRQLIEDELLGSLPLAPMHASAAECEPMAEAVVEAKPDAALQDTNRPFAGLDALLKGVNK